MLASRCGPCSILCALTMAASIHPSRADLRVWTVTTCARALRNAEPGHNAAASLQAARNEWRSFQILLRSDIAVGGVTLHPADLTGPGGTTLPAADARLFRQHQLELTVASFRNEAFTPGWYPDALIPFNHPVTRAPLTGARFSAVPFDLPPDETHGFWVDVYIPPDAPAGIYRGAYTVRAAGQQTVTVPVGLEVWDFELPAVPTYTTAFGSPAQRMRGYCRLLEKRGEAVEPVDWKAVDRQCAEMLSRHRINAVPPAGTISPKKQPDGSYTIPQEEVQALREFVDTYHINAFAVPRPSRVFKDPDADRAELHAWLGAWDRAVEQLDRPHVTFYTYLKDEPNDEEAYRFVQRWGRAIREADSVVKVMVVEQTWAQKEEWGTLHGSVDIWCPLFPIFKAESAVKRQALGETVWTYTALSQRSPMSPWWAIDHPLLHYRVPAWISWRYGIRGLLYWGGMSYWRQVDDPWTEPKTLDRRENGKGTHVWNGEGSMVYPGRAVGYDGIAPSLRLKALRDAVQDYEYMAILERAGLTRQTRLIVQPLAESWFQWEKDPAAYEAARSELAALIVASRKHHD